MKEAESSPNGGNISKERLLKILVENRKLLKKKLVCNRTCKNRLVELNNSFNFDFYNILKSWTICQLFLLFINFSHFVKNSWSKSQF